MPVVPINYLAIFVAGLISMFLGFLWYGAVFGKQWIALMGFPPAEVDAMRAKGQGAMWKQYLLNFIAALVMAYVLSHSIVFVGDYLGVEGASAGLMSGFWSWLGFIAPVTLGSVLWEGRSWKLWFFNNGYQLLNLLAIGVLLSVWR